MTEEVLIEMEKVEYNVSPRPLPFIWLGGGSILFSPSLEKAINNHKARPEDNVLYLMRDGYYSSNLLDFM